MAIQEGKTRTFFFILEKSYSSIANEPPEYIAHAPEFNETPKFASIVGTGSSDKEAVQRLRHHIEVVTCGSPCINIFSKHANSIN